MKFYFFPYGGFSGEKMAINFALFCKTLILVSQTWPHLQCLFWIDGLKVSELLTHLNVRSLARQFVTLTGIAGQSYFANAKSRAAGGKNGASQVCDIFIMPLEINFKEELLHPMETLQKDMSISLLPILCLLAGSLAVLLSVVAGILECSRRKYNVSNEVTHISFSNNLDLNPSNFDSFSYYFFWPFLQCCQL